MLTFNLFDEDARDGMHRVHVIPACVESVVETKRRPLFGGWQEVAVITMSTGESHVVYDSSRTVAAQIYEALEN